MPGCAMTQDRRCRWGCLLSVWLDGGTVASWGHLAAVLQAVWGPWLCRATTDAHAAYGKPCSLSVPMLGSLYMLRFQ